MKLSTAGPTGPSCFGVDVQVNGGALGRSVDGLDQLDFSRRGPRTDGPQEPGVTAEQCAALTDRLARLGVKVYLPTLITAAPEVLLANLAELARFRKTPEGKHCPGIHLEGCFLVPTPGYLGAHPGSYCIQGEQKCLDLYRRLQDAADGGIRLLTVGPDVQGIERTIRAARADNAVVAIGHFGPEAAHSDPARLADPQALQQLRDRIQSAVDAGASLSTHLGNGTHTLVHRHGGHILLQMSHPNLAASLITDGIHLPPEFITAAVASKRPPQVWLVSDASPLEGAKPGRYMLWENPVEVVPAHTGFQPTFKVAPEGKPGLLAGSWATLPDCMNHLVQLLHAWERQTDIQPHYSLQDICLMACDNPLGALGYRRADFEALDGAQLHFDGARFTAGK